MKQIFNTIYLFFFLFFFAKNLPAQVVGGDNVFEFLNLSPSARITALGGNLITVRDDDVNLAYANPASLNRLMHNQLSFNHNFYPAGIGQGYVAYGHHLKKPNLTLHGGIQYVSYGEFDATDHIGNVEGTFKAAEYAFVLGAGKQLYERLSVGANLKFITSSFESYRSSGITGDLAAIFHDTVNQLNFTLLFKNIGGQLTTYTPGNREPVPFEMQMGISKRLKYLPFRFSFIYQYVNRWNILYDDPNSEEFGSIFDPSFAPEEKDPWLDNFARHLIFNGEFLMGKKENFRLRFGYNHLHRKELALRNLRSLAGFSMGIGLKISRFRVEFGRSFVHLGAGANHFSVSTNFREFSKNN